MTTHADEARRIVDAMKTCQTHHPEKWLEPIAAALAAADATARAEGYAAGERAGIERAIGPVEALRKSMEIAEQAFGPWTIDYRRVEPAVMVQCAIDAIRALLPAAVAEPDPATAPIAEVRAELERRGIDVGPATERVLAAVHAAKCKTCRGTGSLPCNTVMCKDKPSHPCPDCAVAEPAACTCRGNVPWHEMGCPREKDWTPMDAAMAIAKPCRRPAAKCAPAAVAEPMSCPHRETGSLDAGNDAQQDRAGSERDKGGSSEPAAKCGMGLSSVFVGTNGELPPQESHPVAKCPRGHGEMTGANPEFGTPACSACGAEPAAKCPTCGGSGAVQVGVYDGAGLKDVDVEPCPSCAAGGGA